MVKYEDLMLKDPESANDGQLMDNVRELLDRFKGTLVEYLEPVEQTTRSRLLQMFEIWKQVSLRRIVDLSVAAQEMAGKNWTET